MEIKEKNSTEKEEILLFAHFDGIKSHNKLHPKYENWVQLDSFQWGVGMGVSSPGRNRYGNDDEDEEEVDEKVYPERECSDCSVSEVTVTKSLSPESPNLLYQVATKKAMETVLIEMVKRVGDKYTPQMKFILFKVYISGLSISYGGGRNKDSERVNESLSLNFAGIEFITFQDGQSFVSVHYHLAAITATLKTGPNLDIADKYMKEKKKKKEKKEDGKKEDDMESGNQ